MSNSCSNGKGGQECRKGRNCEPLGAVVRAKRKHIKSHFEPKQWSFEETNHLMHIWSKLNLDSFDTKRLAHKHIQTQLRNCGFDRNVEQIRCKIVRMTCNHTLDIKPTIRKPIETKTKALETKSEPKDCEPIEQQLDEVLSQQSDSTSLDSSEEDINGLVLSDSESDSEESIFSLTSCPTRPKTDLKRRDDYEKEANERLLDSLQDLKDTTNECFKQIMSGQQQLKDSIESFNHELNRLSDFILNNNSNFDINSIQDITRKSKQQNIKLVIPNVNKQYIIDMNEDI